MCFSERQSYINTILLVLTGLYVLPEYRLSIPLIFLAVKDLIQGLSYNNIKKNKSTEFLTTLSWIHISFQPLFVNLFLSHFDQKFKYWNLIFIISIIYGFFNLTTLKKFDIQNDDKCIKTNIKNDFCSKKTMSYIGKYHLGYKFATDKYYKISMSIYRLLLFVPALFTKAKYLALLWFIFVLVLVYPLYNVIGSGEINAMWCFLSIIYALPVALFHKNIKLQLKFFRF